ncbi:hypothetical protein [Amycolatopsis eburnea]|uniref:Uncharacterized protein n=1 Tax=Amycolatopsis eburnea TaxID=2267691 RepID=A0A427T3C6_9PSEU|nr:hypothetical protein [Amycolatopsis eburnea]RSD13267.1 hypothetical protein EIY87_26315 [Amycolatopsis eburnea]
MLATWSFPVYSVLSGVVWAFAVLPQVPVLARFLVFTAFVVAHPLLRWRRVRDADRAAVRVVPAGARPAAGQVGWWYLAAVATTFAGSAVLCAGIGVHPVAWAAALVIGAAYSVLGVAVHSCALIEVRRHRLPPGHYGTQAR